MADQRSRNVTSVLVSRRNRAAARLYLKRSFDRTIRPCRLPERNLNRDAARRRKGRRGIKEERRERRTDTANRGKKATQTRMWTEMSTPWLIVITLYLHERCNRSVKPRCNCKCFERLRPVDRWGHSPRRNVDKETPFRMTVCHDSASRRVSDGKRGNVLRNKMRKTRAVRVKRRGTISSVFNGASP